MSKSLQQYVRSGSPEAFACLVREHADAVYSQSLRQLRDPALAEEVTQQVFITLAAKAGRISNEVVLAGWLFNTTRHRCLTIKRTELRRRIHEKQFMQMRAETADTTGDSLYSAAEPLLNDAIAGLPDRDRHAVLLRFFHGRSMREIGGVMGVSEDAAKQRISRAVEKLRHWFGRQGVVVPSATLGVWLEQSVKPAPPHVAARIAGLSLAKPAGITSWFAGHLISKVLGGFMITAAAGAAVIAIADNSAKSTAASSLLASDAPPPAPGPATAPTSRSLGSQATPIDALKKFAAALRADDRASIDACLTDDGTDPAMATLVRANLHMDAAWSHVQSAAEKSFKTGDVPFKTVGFSMFPFLGGGYEALIDRMFQEPQPPETKINGDIASVKINLPRELFGGTGPNRARPLERWSGALFILKNVDGDWEIDTDRTINLNLHCVPQDKKADPMKVALQLNNMLVDALEDGASKIESGEYATPQSAGEAMERNITDTFQACHVEAIIFMDLPVVGGP